MIVFPNAKINLGLNITARRTDGYHDLDMVMIPIGWRDILEIVPAKSGRTTLTVSGRQVDCPIEKNLVYRAWRLLSDQTEGDIPAVDIYLHKVIPDGAGLGGGSADAAFTLKALNELFALGYTQDRLAAFASLLGADCPFFIYNRPMHCTGTGTDMEPINIDYGETKAILISKPTGVSVSTAEAYRDVKPAQPAITTDRIVTTFRLADWNGRLNNGFEPHIFIAHPEIADIKRKMLDQGAVYASMSGSGAAVYGFFNDVKMAEQTASQLDGCDSFVDRL